MAFELTLEQKIATIFDCDIPYANKIIASLKMNLPIQGATPKQMFEGYSEVHRLDRVDRLYEFIYCGMTEESSYATISVHRTREGAEKALNNHKEKEKIEYDKKMQRYIDSWKKEDYSDNVIKELSKSIGEFGRFQDWGINEINVEE